MNAGKTALRGNGSAVPGVALGVVLIWAVIAVVQIVAADVLRLNFAPERTPAMMLRVGVVGFFTQALALMIAGCIAGFFYHRKEGGAEHRGRRIGFVAVVGAVYWLTTAISHFTHPGYGSTHLKWVIGLPVTLLIVCAGGLLSVMFDKTKNNK